MGRSARSVTQPCLHALIFFVAAAHVEQSQPLSAVTRQDVFVHLVHLPPSRVFRDSEGRAHATQSWNDCNGCAGAVRQRKTGEIGCMSALGLSHLYV